MNLSFDQYYDLISPPADGQVNMLIDKNLLDWVVGQNKTTLVFRTYQWSVPTVSLGIHQKDNLDLFGAYSVVRRPTGGRAILHGNDVSFTWVTNHPSLLKRPLKEAYCLFNGWIQQGLLQHKQLDTTFESCIDNQSNDRAYVVDPWCLNTKTPQDLVDNIGRKIVGAAQARTREGLLQHGSIFLPALRLQQADFHQCVLALAAEDWQPFPSEALNVISLETCRR